MPIRAAALSDIGLHRRENEDRYVADDRLGLYGVADGIGGLPHGALAAAAAVETVQRQVAMRGGKAIHALPEIVASANEEVLQLGRRLSPLYGIGTTLTFGILDGTTLRLAHVGDSRCYLLQGGRLTLATMDHNVGNELRLRRQRGERVEIAPGNRAALTRCIGQWTVPAADLSSHALTPGDRCLFCTDGLTRSVKEDELEAMLADGDDPADTARQLVTLANRRGGLDNITTVVLFAD